MTRIWRAVFLAEAGGLALVCAFWLYAPGEHVALVLGADGATPEAMMVERAAAAAICAWTFLYANLLLRRVELGTFRLVQQALALASVLLVAVGYGLWREGSSEAGPLLAHLLVLGTTLGIRAAFLARTREPVLILEAG